MKRTIALVLLCGSVSIACATTDMTAVIDTPPSSVSAPFVARLPDINW